MTGKILRIGNHRFWAWGDQDEPDDVEFCRRCGLQYSALKTMLKETECIRSKNIPQEGDGALIKTILAIRNIAETLNKDRFTAEDVYAIGKHSAIFEDREFLWNLQSVEVLMTQLADSKDTIKYDNHLFQRPGDVYRLISNEERYLSEMAAAEDEASGFPEGTGFRPPKKQEDEDCRWRQCPGCGAYRAQRQLPEDPKNWVWAGGCRACDRIASLQRLLDGNVKIIEGESAETLRKKLQLAEQHIEDIKAERDQLQNQVYAAHASRDMTEGALDTALARAAAAENTIEELNQIIEDAMAEEAEQKIEEEKPPFEIGAQVYRPHAGEPHPFRGGGESVAPHPGCGAPPGSLHITCNHGRVEKG